ncbi:glycine zipper family protein [Micromonospora chalcea]|uniref:glycine zipper family protein n=1 Tax=Micromonospora chalcea TaxID=1874 RepID=UPI0033E33686
MDSQQLDKFMGPCDPYAVFETWWGEPLNEEMIKLATSAPLSQQLEFLAFAQGFSANELPELDAGFLRPLITPDPVYTHDSLERYYGSALNVLLYAHQVVVEYSFGYPSQSGLARFRRIAPILLMLKPLADAGAIHFLRARTTRAYHPSVAFERTQGTDNLVPTSLWRRFTASIDGLSKPESFKDWDYGHFVFHFQVFLGAALNLKHRWPSGLQLLTRSDAEQAMLEIDARRAALSTRDLRQISLQKLAGLSVPEFGVNIPGLVALRTNGDTFHQWRDGLSRALNQVGELPNGARDWEAEARSIVAAEMSPLREALEAEARGSSFLSSVRGSLKSFTISGLGAAAGALTGDDLTSALVGAGTATLGDAAVQHIRRLRERKAKEAVLDLMLSFSERSISQS